MADVFISYASQDAKLVRELVKILENQDRSVFWDRDLAVGGDFEKQLEKELSLASCVLVVWSEHSTESSWVRAEAHEALKRGCLVPVRIDSTSLPFVFRTTETADLVGWPIESRSVELRKLVMAVNLAVEGAASQESTRQDLKIRDDPTLSTRVAHRVLDALSGQRDSGPELTLETIIADVAMARLSGASPVESAKMLLAQLMAAFKSRSGLLIVAGEEYLQAPPEDKDDLVSIASFATESSFQAPAGDSAGKGFCRLVSAKGDASLTFLLGEQADLPALRLERLEMAFSSIIAG